ncbi:MAG: hypothetical protein CVU54_09680 [Deltaproteobacteria bacterium HGW-Deltaproteobacteria-12]|nr:MAG: hypothetical protein CVU54_09680 [Deltaproteobacteria bacterium HGW-Deltaproteobacteria-12]
MKKQNAGDEKVRKTAFTMDEYNRTITELEFIKSSLRVALEVDCTEEVLPIIAEAFDKADNIYQLMQGIKPTAANTL